MAHTVHPNALGWFDVVSGDSGRPYRVTPLGGAVASCDCQAGIHGRACKHVAAVRAFAAKALMAARMAELDSLFAPAVSSPEATVEFLMEDE